METKVSTNGKAKDGKKEIETQNGAAALQQVTEKPVSANERILRADNFKILTDRFHTMRERQDSLKKLILSKDGSKETLTIKNNNGRSYEITNTNVIAEVVEFLLAKGEAALRVTEQEIVDFKI